MFRIRNKIRCVVMFHCYKLKHICSKLYQDRTPGINRVLHRSRPSLLHTCKKFWTRSDELPLIISECSQVKQALYASHIHTVLVFFLKTIIACSWVGSTSAFGLSSQIRNFWRQKVSPAWEQTMSTSRIIANHHLAVKIKSSSSLIEITYVGGLHFDVDFKQMH